MIVETTKGVEKQDKRREKQLRREELESSSAFVAYTDSTRNIAVGDDTADSKVSKTKGGVVGSNTEDDSGVYHKQVVTILEIF